MNDDNDQTSLQKVTDYAIDVLQNPSSHPLLPDRATLRKSESALIDRIPEEGYGIDDTLSHLLHDIAPGLSSSSQFPFYYGFVTGGVTPAARLGEVIVFLYDQNAAVHLPDESLATTVEDKALKILLDLFHLDRTQWSGQFTTGATASNIVGLALGREHIINRAVERMTGDTSSTNTVGASGLLRACRLAGLEDIMVLTTAPHSSLGKAASILGLGRDSLVDVGKGNNSVSFDFPRLESLLRENSGRNGFIVVVSCSEVNSGLFATDLKAMQGLRSLCDRYGAWIHVDGAFGLFARLLAGEPGYRSIWSGAAGIELADSITGDAHKLLNVPYDCGFLFSRSGPRLSEQVFQNANAPYLKTASNDDIRSPLNIGLENSRRFRALPVYTSLIAYGRDGYKKMLIEQIGLARAIASHILHQEAFELLPFSNRASENNVQQNVFIIVLFRATDQILNGSLVKRINASSQIYCSETSFEGRPATRIAVSNWQAKVSHLEKIRDVLSEVLSSWKAEIAR